MTDLEIQEYIETNCRNEHGEPMMDEQTFYEGAKWYRDKVVNKLPIPVVVGRSELFKCPACCDTKVKDNGDYCADCEEPPEGI